MKEDKELVKRKPEKKTIRKKVSKDEINKKISIIGQGMSDTAKLSANIINTWELFQTLRKISRNEIDLSQNIW